ncbi:hypothetical protein ABER99_21530 [Paenibacillus glucanolyticus]|jgi:hypothetical protein|uniref:Uncharacterized protein n=1 Tax=Paenibacillus glucanolyticus TaxID=59843 RepID=A0A163GU46_9BACL|nr:hypothetical protein [Paenibacillus glucanolyticus]KZS45153.1 hypothetical protein AWU65_03995 [Paenibacillus glucanolyticus]OMF64431.1 hypothetical protein BK142_31940 [Paenibacillus glucanolyticus]
MNEQRIAFITESSTRQATELPAYLFYQSPKSRWVNEIIRYMEAREFPREDIYFLSHYEQRIIPFEQTISDYPQTETTRSAAKQFAENIVKFVKSYDPIPFIELHMSRVMTDPLKAQFEKNGIRFRIYGESVSLAMKPGHYQQLIEEEENKRRLKDIQREKHSIISELEMLTPLIAREILTNYQYKAQLFGVENIFEEIKELLKSYGNRKKDSDAAEAAFLSLLKKQDHLGEVENFLLGKDTLPKLFKEREHYEKIKSRYGKLIAKFTKYLIKRDYVLQMENKIAATLNKLRVALI